YLLGRSGRGPGDTLLRHHGADGAALQCRGRRVDVPLRTGHRRAARDQSAAVRDQHHVRRLPCLRHTRRLPDESDGIWARRLPFPALPPRRRPPDPPRLPPPNAPDPAPLPLPVLLRRERLKGVQAPPPVRPCLSASRRTTMPSRPAEGPSPPILTIFA